MHLSPSPTATRYLFVEDDETLLRSMVRALWPRVGAIDMARSVQEADALLTHRSDRPWSGIVADVYLADGCGLDWLLRARQQGHARTPAMVLTGHHHPALVNRAFALRAHLALKPLPASDIEAFLSTSDRRVNRRCRASTGAPSTTATTRQPVPELSETLRPLARAVTRATAKERSGSISRDLALVALARAASALGSAALEAAATAVGSTRPSLGRYGRVGRRYSPAEIEAWLQRVGAGGGRLSLNHLVAVAAETRGARPALLERALAEQLSVVALADHVRRRARRAG